MELDLAGKLDGGAERFAPETLAGRLAEARRLAAYRWAASFAAGRRVLDANAQLGHGTAILARAAASSVAGVVPAEPLAEAARSTLDDDVVLRVASDGALPFPADAFDLVVALASPTSTEGREAALRELRRVVAPGGVAVLALDERLAGVVGKQFRNVRTVHVRSVLGALVQDGRTEGAALESLLADEEGESQLALCSDAPLPAQGAAVVLSGPVRLDDWVQRAEAQVAALEEQSRAIAAARKLAADRAQLADRLLDAETRLAGLPTLERRLAELERERDEALASAQAERERTVQALDSVRTSLSWRVTRPLRALARRARR